MRFLAAVALSRPSRTGSRSSGHPQQLQLLPDPLPAPADSRDAVQGHVCAQPLERGGAIVRVEVGALQVLHQTQQRRVLVAGLADDGGDRPSPGGAAGGDAAVPGATVW